MDNNKFREKIYGPYNEAWKILKLVQHYTMHEGDWDAYEKELRRFFNTFPETKFTHDLFQFVMQAAEDIRDMNEEERQNEAPDTHQAK